MPPWVKREKMSVNKKTTWYPQGQEEAPGMMNLCAILWHITARNHQLKYSLTCTKITGCVLEWRRNCCGNSHLLIVFKRNLLNNCCPFVCVCAMCMCLCECVQVDMHACDCVHGSEVSVVCYLLFYLHYNI